MATNLDDFTAIRTRFFAIFPSSIPVILDNEVPVNEVKDGVHARLTLRPGVMSTRSIYSKTYTQSGRAYLQVMVPVGIDAREGHALAETFATAFRQWSSPDYRVRFDNPEFDTSDAEDDYYVVTVSIKYLATH